jgi:signal transduction histidine kinase
MISLMRFILALSALIIIYIDPSEPDRFVAVTYAALIVYTAYSAVLFLLSRRRYNALPVRIAHWIDIGCYLILVALSSGTNSIFFFFFFFAILIASFRWGFKAGLQATIVSTLLFTPIAYVSSPAGKEFELNRFLLRPVYMLVLGYMMAYWGGSEIAFKRRLRLLKDVAALANPRFGLEHMLCSVMKRLREFFGADCSVVVYFDSASNQHRLLRIDEGHIESAQSIPESLAQTFRVPEEIAVVYKPKPRGWAVRRLDYYAFERSEKTEAQIGEIESATIATQLEVRSFVSMPFTLHDQTTGQLFLGAQRRLFTNNDAHFIAQVIEQVKPILDNIRLLERLTSSIAEQERQRLARDIHDSVIQPYVGLQYKLAAIRNKAAKSELAPDIERLFQVTANEISNLRGFVGGLKQSDRPREDRLRALRRFAEQFAESYDIVVEVQSNGFIDPSNRLAAEVIAIVHEGLSNIRKHTGAKHSLIRLERTNNHLVIQIENDILNDAAPPPQFQPKSITERAQDLGGGVRVDQNRKGRTVVTVDIPL